MLSRHGFLIPRLDSSNEAKTIEIVTNGTLPLCRMLLHTAMFDVGVKMAFLRAVISSLLHLQSENVISIRT